ncbi:hypothetical protein NV379_20125 [Paenibacillus sp. N1-5-1-14]|uniref:hypothetical protein n=1 Tax=Paenibacillus radicibacter TaxID=2972488 RepID=UPI002158F3A3|nr:hypothetical protein [Paenibacillus radicibacter]MCR8644964.1 hypothetical protein [Paenibacillus radicibacter]
MSDPAEKQNQQIMLQELEQMLPEFTDIHSSFERLAPMIDRFTLLMRQVSTLEPQSIEQFIHMIDNMKDNRRQFSDIYAILSGMYVKMKYTSHLVSPAQITNEDSPLSSTLHNGVTQISDLSK